MILSRKHFPLWLRYVLFNGAAVLILLWKGQFRSDGDSVLAIIVAFALMNFVAWVSSKNFKEWK